MAIGERIRFIRNLRGFTQKWLGAAVGFPEKTADIRMAQYESGSRTPKEDFVQAVADVLEVSPLALKVPDIDSNLGFIHTLFAIEDLHGCNVEEIDGQVHLVFDVKKPSTDPQIFQMLMSWSKQAEKFRNGEMTKEQYDQWRYTYPRMDKSQHFVKVMPQDLSNVIVKDLEKEKK